MTSSKGALAGFVTALLIGGGGGVLLGPLSASTSAAAVEPPVRVGPARILIQHAQGEVEALLGTRWRRVKQGDQVTRPTVLRTRGPDASLTATCEGLRFVADQEARLQIGGGAPFMLQLDGGRILVHSASGAVRINVPINQASVTAESFGLWSRPTSLVASVLDKSLTLETVGGISTQYAKGRQITLSPRGPTPVVMEPELKVELERVEKVGKSWSLTGRTVPSSLASIRRGDAVNSVEVSNAGTFTFEVDESDVRPSDVSVTDAAGRRATGARPSESYERVLAGLVQGVVPAPASAQPAPQPKKAEPEPTKVEPPPEVVQEPKPAAVEPKRAESKSRPKQRDSKSEPAAKPAAETPAAKPAAEKPADKKAGSEDAVELEWE